jgi:hypothetical protein
MVEGNLSASKYINILTNNEAHLEEDMSYFSRY